MKFGVREICDVVLKAKAAQKIGNKVFYKNEPVLYFDSLKTSSMEGAATTVYAQGGRGNARLVAWEGERTVTFTMEDALISQTGLMILTGAGLIEAKSGETIKVHTTEQTDEVYPIVNQGTGKIESVKIYLKNKPYLPASGDITSTDARSKYDYIYVMLLKDGEIITEPYIAGEVAEVTVSSSHDMLYEITLSAAEAVGTASVVGTASDDILRRNSFESWSKIDRDNVVLVDYYVEHASGAYQIDITPETFGGNFYLEASTLFRDTNGVDMPAEFVIPNCKVQSNFTFTMASSGDPSTFTFTMDAFPDYTRFNQKKKVLAAIQVVTLGNDLVDLERYGTGHDEVTYTRDSESAAVADYNRALGVVDPGTYGSNEGRSQFNIIEQGGRK